MLGRFQCLMLITSAATAMYAFWMIPTHSMTLGGNGKHRQCLPASTTDVEMTCAGARCTATLLHEMNKRGKSSRFGIVSMCIGSGMGAAAVFERGGEVDRIRNARKVATQDYLSRDAAV